MVKIKCPNSRGFRRFRVCRFDKSEKMSTAAANKRRAPTAGLGTGLCFGTRTQTRHAGLRRRGGRRSRVGAAMGDIFLGVTPSAIRQYMLQALKGALVNYD